MKNVPVTCPLKITWNKNAKTAMKVLPHQTQTHKHPPPPTHSTYPKCRYVATTNIVNHFRVMLVHSAFYTCHTQTHARIVVIWTLPRPRPRPPRTIWILRFTLCTRETALFVVGRRRHYYFFITCFFYVALHAVAGTGHTPFNQIVVAVYISKLFGMYAKWNNSHAIFHFGMCVFVCRPYMR